MTKLLKYCTVGGREYRIADPDKQVTRVYGIVE